MDPKSVDAGDERHRTALRPGTHMPRAHLGSFLRLLSTRDGRACALVFSRSKLSTVAPLVPVVFPEGGHVGGALG